MTATLDPVATAERWLATVRLDETGVLFVIGFGDGHVLDALERRGWSGHVVALEPDSASAAECLSRNPVREWQLAGRLTVLAGPDYTGLDKALAAVPLTTEKPVIAGNPEVARAHREACVHAARTVTRAWFGARANDEARKKNAGRYLQNTLRNADAIVREGDAAALKNLFAGVPALVVAAGPSLGRNIPDISRYRDRVMVIAADTALRPLLAAGIEPDLVVATDPTETNARHLNDLPACPRTHLVAEGSVDPESLPHFEGRTFFFRIADHHPWPWLRQSGHDRVRLRAWGSVLTTAFDLALEMGCGPIVFSGADLAFTDGRPYARGTTYEEVWRRAEMWGQPIEDCWSAAIAGWPDTREAGVTGDIVRTAPHLRSFRDWIVAEAAKATGRRIINGTGGGILVGEGIAQQSLTEALSALPILGPDVTARISAARRAAGAERAAAIGEADEATLAAWEAFAGPAVAPSLPATIEPTVEEPEVVFDCLPDVDLNAAIEAAWQNLGAGHQRLVLRDQTGTPAGAAVRRALFAFLERHPEVSARFGRFFDLDEDRSWIDRRPMPALSPGEERSKWEPRHAQVANRLVPLIVERLRPSSVLDVGCGAGFWSQAFMDHGVTDVTSVVDLAAETVPSRRFDLCLCVGVVHTLPASTAEAVVARCAASSDTVVFSVPSAAIDRPGFINGRPSGVWHDLFLQHGFAAHDELRPRIEEAWGEYQSAFDLLVVYRRVATSGDAMPAPIRSALSGAARRADDLVLQHHWHIAALRDAQQQSLPPRLPRVDYQFLVMEPSRMEAGDRGGVRAFGFRSSAGAFWLATADADLLAVREDEEPLARVDRADVVQSGHAHGFAVHGSAVVFSSADGTDPRLNRRRYSVRVPTHIAWLERLPLATILEHRL